MARWLRKACCTGGLFLAIGAGSAGSALADEKAYVDEVLRALEAKGLLSAEEVAGIKQRAGEAERAAAQSIPPTSGQVAQQAPAQPATQAPEDHPSKDGPLGPLPKAEGAQEAAPKASVAVWGRVQPRYTYIESDELEGTNSFTFRRARFGMRGRLTPEIAFYTQYEAANDTPTVPNTDQLLDTWVRWEGLRDSIGDIALGQQFIPGYARGPQLGASVERKFTEFLSPGTAGRARGIAVRKGTFGGTPESGSPALFNDRLHLGVGIYNSPDINTNNDNNELLYSGAFALTPLGTPITDEYEIRNQPFKYLIGGWYVTSRDSGALDTRGQTSLGPTGAMDNEWYGIWIDAHAHYWFWWGSYAEMRSEANAGGLLVDTSGALKSELSSDAWALGVSRSFPLFGGKRFFALGAQAQGLDNEHPSRTRFFRVLTGTSPAELARGMNRGNNYSLIATWMWSPVVRLINEYTWFDSDDNLDYGAFVTQLQIDF